MNKEHIHPGAGAGWQCPACEEPMNPLLKLSEEFDEKFLKGTDMIVAYPEDIKQFYASRLPEIIRQTVISILPEEEMLVEDCLLNCIWCAKKVGHNSCRQQILTNLEKLKI